MVPPVGFEPTTSWSEARRSNPLSYGGIRSKYMGSRVHIATMDTVRQGYYAAVDRANTRDTLICRNASTTEGQNCVAEQRAISARADSIVRQSP